MACGWPLLPWRIRIGDLVFPALLAQPLTRWRVRRLDLFLLLFIAGSALSIAGSLDARLSLGDVLKELYLFAAYLALAGVMAQSGVRPVARWLPIAVAATSALSLAAALVFTATG